MKKSKPTVTRMVSFRADKLLWTRLACATKRADRKLADTVRRLVIKALDAEEAALR